MTYKRIFDISSIMDTAYQRSLALSALEPSPQEEIEPVKKNAYSLENLEKQILVGYTTLECPQRN